MQLTEYSLRRPVTTAMVALSAVVLGVVALRRLPVEQYPEVSSTNIRLDAHLENASPEEVERRVTIPLERAAAAVGHYERIESVSWRGGARVRVELKPGTDVMLIAMRMQERVDRARASMPENVDRIKPSYWYSGRGPILNARLTWEGDTERLLDITRKVIEPRILRIDGVADVVIGSIQYRELHVDVDQQRLRSHGLTMDQLGWQVRENNANLSIGRVRDGPRQYQARLVSEFQDPHRIGELPLIGSGLQQGDLGDVFYGYPPRFRYERLNGRESIEVMVYRTSAANLLRVGQAIRETIESFEETYPGMLHVGVVRDHAARVLREASTLMDTAGLGVFLAMGVIFVFMRNIRSTVIAGLAIPTSALCVFIGLYLAREVFGSTVTLNMVTMIGMMLAVGMLADPAVVVLDSIFRHRREDGLAADEAALAGGREVGMALLASCLTTTCVFVPFFFLSDSRSAAWMRDAGMAICLAVIMSMLVALTLLPLVASRLFRDGVERYDRLIKLAILAALAGLVAWRAERMGLDALATSFGRWRRLIGESLTGLEWSSAVGLLLGAAALGVTARYLVRNGLRPSYVRLLSWTLDHRWVVLAATAGLTATGYHLYSNIEHMGMPWRGERRVLIAFAIDRSYSLDEVKEHFLEIERRLLARKTELDIESLVTDFVHGGGRVEIHLVNADDGHLTTEEVREAVMALLPKKVGITEKLGYWWTSRTHGVEVNLYGRDPDVLAVLMNDATTRMLRIPGVKGVINSLEDGGEEVHVTVDRARARSHGIAARDVAAGISTGFGAWRSSGFKDADRQLDVVLQPQEHGNLDQLRASTFTGRDGRLVQLASLADVRVRPGPRSLNRANRQLEVSMFAHTMTQEEADRLSEPIEEMVSSMDLPPGYTWDLASSTSWWEEEEEDDTGYIAFFAVLLIYLIMASLFESLAYPFTIMLAIPFSLIGVALGLSAFDITFDDNGTLGLLILFGIVVNNGIVLIDHVNHLRARGMARREAILLGGARRLRPILMTAATTILNLMPIVIPMAYGTAEGFARRWGPTSLVVVSGLATSTLLTLVLAPTLYCLLDDVAVWLRQVLRLSLGTGSATEPTKG